MKKIILTAFATLFLLVSHAQNGVYAGGDISMLPEYEGSSTKYLDAQGNVIPDLIPWLISDCGWNT
ncbi:MAG: arabinogalactan endo-1,4-beta-galactosidase, partial [Prevotella sp.]|nr:arabinogalactan endo-1,4-beta-galactosidase [Prevotella sp.]